MSWKGVVMANLVTHKLFPAQLAHIRLLFLCPKSTKSITAKASANLMPYLLQYTDEYMDDLN